MKTYELINACDVFDGDNDGLKYGINWLDSFGKVADCEWFRTRLERNKAIREVSK